MAEANKKKVRIVGVGHSPSSIACSNDYMVSLKKFNKIIDVKSFFRTSSFFSVVSICVFYFLKIDQTKMQVKVEGGMRMDTMSKILHDNNMAFSV